MINSIVTKGLTKVYVQGAVTVNAVSSVDLQIREGEVIGLFGPSGSGKTTLLCLLGCILRPTSGAIRIYDNETSDLNESELPRIRKHYISFIFQGFNLFPALTAYENIMLVLNLKGLNGTKADMKAQELMDHVGLTDRMNFLPRDLSGGQKQRVAIARALAADSPIILADEPTGNLDHANGRKAMDILRKLASEKKRCVIVATHDNRIEDIFDRILFMEDGQIIREKGNLS